MPGLSTVINTAAFLPLFFGKKIPAQAFKPVPVVLLFAAAAIVTADAFKF